MQAELIRDDLEVGPNAAPELVERQAELRTVRVNGRDRKRLHWKRGTIIDNPRAVRLVQQGVALPADDECREAADMSPADLQAAQQAYERTRLGIVPDDFPLFDAGIIAGYEGDGSYKPGPNAHMAPDVFTDPDDEDEDDDE